MDTAAPPKDGEHPPFTIALKRLFQHVYIPEALPENTNIKMTIVHIGMLSYPKIIDPLTKYSPFQVPARCCRRREAGISITDQDSQISSLC